MSDNDSILELVKSSYSTVPIYKEVYCGVPENYRHIKTLGELLESNYKYRSTKVQLRENLISKLKDNENPFNGIIGFEETVIPAIKRALLSGHDIIFVGHIGQGKTKLAEMISENLLSPIPVVEGTITNDIPTEIPFTHLTNLLQDKDIHRSVPEFFVSKDCEEIIRNNKLDTKIKWIDGKSRYRYILATPDISVKDLVGQIDVVKVIKKGIEVFDIDSYSPGYLLQARYGILCLDELPVLDPRKQVTLLSVLQEGRFTTGAYPVFFKPDVKIIATANPIDYTHSGKIIEPLADRFRSHIETHYPRNMDDEILILIQEMDMLSRKNTLLPAFMLETIVKIFQSLRINPEINSERGVSVRSTIHSLEILIGEVESSRSINNNTLTIPRFSDIYCISQSSKFELDEIEDTTENKAIFLNSVINETIKEVSKEFFSNFINAEELISIKNEFKGKTFTVLQNQYQKQIQKNKGIPDDISSNNNNSSSNARGGGDSHNKNYNNSFLYAEQLKKFPMTRKILKKAIEKIKEEQREIIKKAQVKNIDSNLQYLDYNNNNNKVMEEFDKHEEIVAAVTELLLEYLRFSIPPILDKKEENKSQYTGV
ncbi:MAG: AAA family ATPase [Candidatus Nitrosocosmicus sp.]